MSEGHEGSVESSVMIHTAASLTPTELAEVRALKAVCDAADGLDLKLSWGDEASECARVFLARDGSRLIGFCALDGEGAVAELCGMVAPEARRRGVGMRLFEAARLAFKQGGGDQLYIICENASEAGRAFVAALSGQRVFSEYRMRLRSDAPITTDATLVIRELTSGDEDELVAAARITAAGFARSFEQTLRGMRKDLTRSEERPYLALADSKPVGAFKLSTVELGTTGIYGFTVDPARQRQGWGRRMLAQASALAWAQGAERVTLEVETNNERAIALYTSSGFETITTYGYYLLSRSLIAGGR